jgi:hypothetical protein
MKPFLLNLKIDKNSTSELNIFGIENLKIKTISLVEPGGDILFQFNSRNNISICIKQLEPVKWEILQLLKDHHNTDNNQIDWNKHIVPIIRNDKIRNIITF